jgi:hypothetical protein
MLSPYRRRFYCSGKFSNATTSILDFYLLTISTFEEGIAIAAGKHIDKVFEIPGIPPLPL